jgi:hypothetical protein
MYVPGNGCRLQEWYERPFIEWLKNDLDTNLPHADAISGSPPKSSDPKAMSLPVGYASKLRINITP